jgi:lipid II:glycine glycyltransferase (peptidoglycan interpeptide bridge formation enzyme)
MNHEPRTTNPAVDFLQSEDWFRFQETAGHEIVRVMDGGFQFGGIVHALPIVGRYLYTPRFPAASCVMRHASIINLLASARSHGCGWVRVEPGTEAVKDEILRHARNDKLKVVRAPHDMQPRETFVVDITKSEEELLAGMKPKVRYNVRLAEKKSARVFQSTDEKYRRAFVDLVTGTADRKGIVPHSRAYYEKMLSVLLGERATLFVAEHEGDILGVNLMVFSGDTAIYLHGGSAEVKRDCMAPFLLQWEAMKDAKRRGRARYDFGGVHTKSKIKNQKSKIDPWEGITRFKTGFSPDTVPTVFPGCYDIILSPSRYFLYRFFSVMRSCSVTAKKFIGI